MQTGAFCFIEYLNKTLTLLIRREQSAVLIDACGSDVVFVLGRVDIGAFDEGGDALVIGLSFLGELAVDGHEPTAGIRDNLTLTVFRADRPCA